MKNAQTARPSPAQPAKGETRNVKRRRPEPKVIDLMAALQASVDQAKKGGKKATPARRRTKKRAAA